MKLIKVKVQKFKRIASAELELADLNILVGGNGSGKSSILQAIHLACCVTRQAERVDRTGSTVGVDELDYLPTEHYATLGHNANWGNWQSDSAASGLDLTFLNDAGVASTAAVTLRSARNAGISIRGNLPSALSGLLRTKTRFFSAYIPGISGIPNSEEKRSEKVILKACSFGDSNIFLRNVLLLLNARNPENLRQIERWISEVGPRVSIVVQHQDQSDLTISCWVSVEGGVQWKPLELLGTGYLQLIQIFAYVLLFSPGILLIDEPDIHLHPSVQESLVKVLARIATERQFKILMTSHSPFVVRGAPPDANVYWVNAGAIEATNRAQVEMALGWGAFGKKVIIVSEDKDTGFLKRIVSQWPGIDRAVTFLPGRGYKSVVTPDQAAEMSDSLGGKYKILIHRDRDSLTDVEVSRIQASYAAKGASIWFPELSDVEAYFCKPAFIQSFLNCSESDANQHVESVLTRNAQPIADQFAGHRAAHNQELYAGGGSPANQDVWNDFQQRPLRGAKGKFVFKQLKNAIPGNVFREEAVLAHSPANEIAPDLRGILEPLVA